jgi:glutathione S-transferase
MLVVHHLGISQSDRIVWLCEELDLDYQLIRYERDAITKGAPSEYRALTPFGTAPVITDDGRVLGESGAIIEYLIATHGKGRLAVGAGAPNFADYLFWFHFANGSVMPSSMMDMVAIRMGGGALAQVSPVLGTRSDRAFALIERRLGETPYLAGNEFTAADIIMGFPLMTMRAFTPRDLGAFPNLRNYLNRIGDRPAYQRAMAAGDPGMTPVLS